MKKIAILKYHLKRVSINNRTLIHRALYGYTDHSNKGAYTYHRRGALKGLKYTKISNSVLLMNPKDIEAILPLFKKYGVRVEIIDLIMP